jgi:oligosaccharide repeat unit polymerase
VPFLFFSILFVFIYLKRGLDVSAVMVAIYAFSAFCAILLYTNPHSGLRNYGKYPLTLFPTAAYCFFNTLLIIPFYKLKLNRPRRIKQLPLKNLKIFDNLVWIYVAILFTILLIYREEILFRLVSSNMEEARLAYNKGEVDITRGFPYFLKLIVYFCVYMGGGSSFMILYFFYSITFLKRSKRFTFLILLSSLCPIVLGILNMDRSNTFFWTLLFILGYFLFKPYMDSTVKKEVNKMGLCVLGVLLLYFIAVTIARFGAYSSGSEGGLLDYAGQSYLNFCNIWNKMDFSMMYLGRVLPITNTFFLHLENPVEVMNEVKRLTGADGNVFFSSIGMFLIDLGKWAVFVVPPFIYFVTKKLLAKYTRQKSWGIAAFIIIFILAVIPQYGVITYAYASFTREITALLLFLISRRFLKLQKRNL